ncbi:MAG: DNA-directed RNA polymerase subunit beta [Deltaproteobacteria bacterium GWC2_55_46]|nr:MAG: DNA-directed RNA polymerase subunit beta [Deltaproteobacteria bacterium GWA2_55_82]OIJ74687.1 MAG: DNA-directed RNA polymerase subunit beta [Deltaproteobacteria bacterium GWC2_55_46]
MASSKRIDAQALRKDYSRIGKVVSMPNLIEVQKKSFAYFLQTDAKPEDRKDVGLQAVFKSAFPIKDFSNTASLEYVRYALLDPKYTVDECHQKGMTFAAPIKMLVRLIMWDKDAETGAQSIRDIKEQEVYFGEIPLMTENGSFIINGTERVIVSQLHRSPGVFFELEKPKGFTGKVLYTARVIPYHGSWLDFEFDQKDWLYVRIDKRRKMPSTILLKALGYSVEEMLNYFYPSEEIILENKKISKSVEPEFLVGQKVSRDIKDPHTGEVIVKKDRKFTRLVLKKLVAAGVKYIPVEVEDIIGRIASTDIVDPNTGEVVLECNQILSRDKLDEISRRGITSFRLLLIEAMGNFFRETLLNDKIGGDDTRTIVEYRKENPDNPVSNMTLNARIEIYKRLKPGDLPTVKTANAFFNDLFFNAERYDLSRVGRLKLNRKLGFDVDLDTTTLRKEDILEVVRYLILLRNGQGVVDDIDHLGNRRVRSVGELLENQYRIGLLRMERAVKERMSLGELETLMPHDLINPKPVSAVIKEFFGSSQLSQFMDQTNPLSEVTHKRRLSALGPGGLTRERAGFEVRDVHATHYGRICPIETPEGPNIGLIVSLSTYARVNDFGFIETPYREVRDGKVTNRITYLSALDEENHVIAQANAPIDKDGRFESEFVSARKGGEFIMARPEDTTLMDVSPNQLVSVAAALIPFLENDDANRALMGSNMQRQAVPLIQTESPLVGTGMESIVASDSGVTVLAKHPGVVESVDGTRIVVRNETGGVEIYNLTKFRRSNQNTCLNQKPVVFKGDVLEVGQVIADGPSTDKGELALGKNVIVAFMPWGGYNFEDSILLNERLLRDDVFTSVHIEEFEVVARDIKLGKEEITRDIPNVGEDALRNLDESGIIRIGAEVKPGDILVGKVTPKGETQLSPEEKLLRAIFGEKAEDVKDTSLRVPPGIEGVVIDAKVFSRKGSEKDDRSKSIEDKEIARLVKDREDEIGIVKESTYSRVRKLLLNKKSAVRIADRKGNTLLSKGKPITAEVLETIPQSKWHEIIPAEEKAEAEVGECLTALNEQIDLIKVVFDERINRLKRGDELPPGVIKMVKVYIAMKRKISVGDKMAGRHGNKGVISRILPEEDMPYLADGTPVDIVLNPLGVPSRMNIGQILETHLGWAAKHLGKAVSAMIEKNLSPNSVRDKVKKIYATNEFSRFINTLSDDEVIDVARRLAGGIRIASPVFDGATETEVKEALEMASLPRNGKMVLYDGRNGEQFDQEVTVGVMYMMKLHHLVDDKIHARSTGPYSLVTQQPLGGKAQFGGQRLGEMEVWAMEAYGAAHSLQEFLTVKSDDVPGRTKMYESIVTGRYNLEPTLPESFSVLIKELQSLALDVNLMEEEKKD